MSARAGGNSRTAGALPGGLWWDKETKSLSEFQKEDPERVTEQNWVIRAEKNSPGQSPSSLNPGIRSLLWVATLFPPCMTTELSLLGTLLHSWDQKEVAFQLKSSERFPLLLLSPKSANSWTSWNPLSLSWNPSCQLGIPPNATVT